MPTKKGKKGKKTAAERERAKELWRRYFEGYDLMMMSYPERLRCVTVFVSSCFKKIRHL